MNRIAQGMVLVLLGAAALGSTLFSDLYLNYVQPGFRWFLVAAGVVMAVLGVLVVASDLRTAITGRDAPHGGCCGDDHGHDHAHAPRVAWLLLLPVVSVFLIAPPALGSYTAANSEPSASQPAEQEESGNYDDALANADGSGPVRMELRAFVSRAWTDEKRTLAGREVELTGFVVPNPEGKGWYLARLEMACCAADASVNRVLVTNQPAPEKDSWWTVRGTWQEPEGDLQEVRDHRFTVNEMETVEDPPDPYE